MARWLQAMGASGYDNGFNLALHPARLRQPLQRKKPTLYFVNSMSDLFHEKVPDRFLDRVFSAIRETPWHTYQVLTKQATRLPRKCMAGWNRGRQKTRIPRIAHLRKVNAKIRFLSIEPLLEDIGTLKLAGIHWVVVGGKSGHKARPMRTAWVSHIKKQADKTNTAFFFKQWGSWGNDGIKRTKKANGRLFQNRTWDAYPA